METPKARARLALMAGLAAAGAASATWPAGSDAIRILFPLLVVAAIGAGWLAPVGTTLLLAAVGPLVPAAPRLLGDFTGPPLLLAGALATGFGALARNLSDGVPSPLPAVLRRWALGFLAVAAASAASSVARGETLYFLLRGRARPLVVNALGMTAGERSQDAVRLFLTLVLLFLAVELFTRLAARDGAGRQRLLAAAATSLLLSGAATVLPLPGPGDAFWGRVGRVAGAFTDPNALGVGIGILLPLGAAAALSGRGAVRIIGVAALLAGALALERSGSRTGLVVAFGAAAAAAVGAVRSGGARRRVAIAGSCVLLAGGLLAVLLLPRTDAPAAGPLSRRLGAALASKSAADLASHRPLFWRAALDVVGQEPLSGCGLGGFPYVFPVLMAESGLPVRFTDNATSAYLDVAAEAGLPALLLALGAAVPLLARGFKAATAPRSGPAGARAAGAALAGFFVATFLGSHFRFPEVAILLALVAAFLPPPVSEDADVPGPRLVLPVLVGSGVLAALLAALPTLSAERAFPRDGWAGAFGSEGVPTGRRWLGGRAFRRILPAETEAVVTLLNDRPDGRAVRAWVEVDGDAAGSVDLPAWRPSRYRVGPLPRGAEALRLRFSPTFVPREINGAPDNRELSVQLASSLDVPVR